MTRGATPLHPAFPTLAMLLVLTLSSASLFCISVLAPEAAPRIGVNEGLVGAFFSLSYAFAVVSGAMTGTLVGRFGAIRVCQLTMVVAAAGLGLVALGHVATAVLGAIVLGIAYGPFNPASAHVLAGVGSEKSRPLVFSIKQSGVPLGGVLCGAAAPAVALAAGWQAALVVVAAGCLASTLALQPLRPHFDGDTRRVPFSFRAAFYVPMRTVLTSAPLRRYTLVAFLLAGAQVSLGAFLVVYLVESVELSLPVAGAVFAWMQLGATVGRLGWGALAERVFSSATALVCIGIAVAVLMFALSRATPDWPLALLSILAAVLGACSFGWNGVLLARIAGIAPLGRASEATGGMQVFMFGGVVVWPAVTGTIAAFAGGYPAAFVVLGAVTLAAACVAWRIRGVEQATSACE